jgi:hypothetical protein
VLLIAATSAAVVGDAKLTGGELLALSSMLTDTFSAGLAALSRRLGTLSPESALVLPPP